MTQQEQQTVGMNQSQTLHDEDTIDIKKLLLTLLSNWYWFVLAVILALTAAFLYNRYATPVYEIQTTVMFEEAYGKSSPMALAGASGIGGNVFEGLGSMKSMQNIHNQMVIVGSTPLVSKVIDQLDFEVSYYAVGRVSLVEAYKSVPFQVIWDDSHPQLIDTDIDLSIGSDGKLELIIEGEKSKIYDYSEDKVLRNISDFSFKKTLQPGEELITDEFSFKILLNERFVSGSTPSHR